LTTADGRVVTGKITSTDNGMSVETASGTVMVTKPSIKTIRSESEQHDYGAWGGFIDSGLSLSRGNSETTTFTLGSSAVRATEKSKTTIFINSLFARSTILGVTATTASAINVGLRYDRNISDRTFGFVFTNFDHDRFQELDLRNVLGGGLGYHAIKTPATTLDLSAGLTFDQEYFTALTRRSAEIVLGEAFDHKLNDRVNLHERLDLYPNLSDMGEYRMVFDTAMITKLGKAFSWQVDLSDRYQSNPLFGLKKNDLLLTTGIRLTFGPQEK
jgi:putative salt-induced outer membrane protein